MKLEKGKRYLRIGIALYPESEKNKDLTHADAMIIAANVMESLAKTAREILGIREIGHKKAIEWVKDGCKEDD